MTKDINGVQAVPLTYYDCMACGRKLPSTAACGCRDKIYSQAEVDKLIESAITEAQCSILRELVNEQKQFIKAQSGHIRNRKPPLYGARVTSNDTLRWLERKLAQLKDNTSV